MTEQKDQGVCRGPLQSHGKGCRPFYMHSPSLRRQPTRATLTCRRALRAPEVVMSRGGYSSAIDMWSMGCIFGELLQRISHVGGAATPALQVAPLFAIHGMPRTPDEGDRFAEPGSVSCGVTRRELQALFDVIGTPSWADVDKVQSPAWRRYLANLPGKAPSLYRRCAGRVRVGVPEQPPLQGPGGEGIRGRYTSPLPGPPPYADWAARRFEAHAVNPSCRHDARAPDPSPMSTPPGQ